MNTDKIKAAKTAAKRFNEAANEYLLVAEKDQRECFYIGKHPKQSGALRRASMDLTRALSDMRK